MNEERRPAAPAAGTITPVYVQCTGDDPIGNLIAAGKCKQAVELAKEEHKRLKTPESQRRLVEAYISRIEQFQGKGSVNARSPRHELGIRA